MKSYVPFVLSLVLAVTVTSTDASIALVDDEEDMGCKLGYTLMNRKKSSG